MPGWPVVPVPSTDVEIVLTYGQSRAACHSEGTGMCWPATCTPTTTGRSWMLNNSQAPGKNKLTGYAGDATALLALQDCRFGNRATGFAGNSKDPLGESLGTWLWKLDAADIAAGRPRKHRILVQAGHGGAPIADLMKYGNALGVNPTLRDSNTTYCYDQMLALVTATNNLARSQLRAQTVTVLCVGWLHAEAEVSIGTTYTNYAARYWQLQSDLRADVKAITGQTAEIPWIADQTASDIKGAGNPCAAVMLDAALGTVPGKTFIANYCIGANYGDPYNNNGTLTGVALSGDGTSITGTNTGANGLTVGADLTLVGWTPSTFNGTWPISAATTTSFTLTATGATGTPTGGSAYRGGGTAHMISEQVAAYGEKWAADLQAIQAGGTSRLCRVTSIVRAANVITLTCSVPAPPLVLDAVIPQATNKGFKLVDAGGAVITSVAVAGTTVTVTLDKAPATGATLQYAYDNPAGVLSSGSAAAAFTDGTVDLSGVAAYTAGAWGNIRDSRADVPTYAANRRIRNWLCQVPPTVIA